MKRLFAILALAISLAASAGTASAMGRCGHGCGGCEPFGCGGPADCGPQYVTVQKTIYKHVPVVTEQEITETICVPKTRVEERERPLLVPVTKEELRKRTVYKCEYVT